MPLPLSDHGFEHLSSGHVLQNVEGGVGFRKCTLVSALLIQALRDHEGQEDRGNACPLPETMLRELTADSPAETSLDERWQGLREQLFESLSSTELYCLISNLWYAGHALTCATKPLNLVPFIGQIQAHGNTVEAFDPVDEWID